jgi:hypothetical protein
MAVKRGGLLASAMLLAGALLPTASMAMPNREVTIDVRVEDRSGHPIPYITVWGVNGPGRAIDHDTSADDKGAGSVADEWDNVTLPDLLKVAERLNESHEVATLYSKPIKGILTATVTDESGRRLIKEPVLEKVAGSGPPSVGYVFIRRGYRIGKAGLRIEPGRDSYSIRVILDPVPGPVVPEPKYRKTFDRVRFEASDYERNTELTEQNRLRLEGLRSQLVDAAEESIDAGDPCTAALIYARIEVMPEILVTDGKVDGYAQSQPDSERNRASIRRAIALCPDKDYFAMRAIREKRRGLIAGQSHPNTDDDLQRLRTMIEEEKAATVAHGVHAWMFDQSGMYFDLIAVKEYERAYAELNRQRALEPKGHDYPGNFEFLTLRMRADGVSIPNTWK